MSSIHFIVDSATQALIRPATVRDLFSHAPANLAAARPSASAAALFNSLHRPAGTPSVYWCWLRLFDLY
ncbi:MAG TPA: hypothetical protein H9721_01645 [Candidatus Limosilactobacillus intestinipullorum]|nr:hypothetical protein [Candidatus Limosilactobacillus intestinipullorum]